MYCIVLQCLCQRYRMIQITDKSLYNLRLTRLQHEAMGSTVLSLRDDAEVRNQIWHVIRAPALSKNIDSPRMTFNEKNNKESINFPNTLKHLEAFRDGHSCAVSTQRMEAPSEVVLHGRWSLATVPSRKTRELASQPETLQLWWWRGGLSRRMEHQWYSCEILPHSVACHWEFLFRASWSCS